MFDDYLDLPYAYGIPSASGMLKSTAEDFVVEEISSFEPVGEGEHLFLHIEKTQYTTEQVAKDLARICDVSIKNISYAGLKDKHARTRQWFSVHCPGKYFPDIEQEKGDQWWIIASTRHLKKLKKGTLTGNAFTLVVRAIDDASSVDTRLQKIKHQGVPNYFTSQRFGSCGQNLVQAKRMLLEHKKVKNRFLAGMYLSAMRSYLFNRQLAARIEQNTWQRVLSGEVLQLSGSRSMFVANQDDLAALQDRLEQQDISPAAILWGSGRQLAQEEALAVQHQTLEPYADYLQAIEQRKVDRAYRAMIVHPIGLQWQWLDAHTLRLTFALPAGSYATAILRELVTEPDFEHSKE